MGGKLAHAGEFFVGDQVLIHEDVIVRDGLHILHLIFEAEELRETEVTERFDGGSLLADEFGFDAFEAALAGDLDEFREEGAREAASAIIGMHMDADPADVTFPAAVLLVQGADADDLFLAKAEQREIALQIDVGAPIVNDGALRDAMLDEQQFAGGNLSEELQEAILIGFFERAQGGREAVLQRGWFWEFFEDKVQRHSTA